MAYSLLADLVLVLHLLFILFVLFGGLLALRWRAIIWLHLLAVVWGVWIEWSSGICPLTPLENSLRQAAGESGYNGGFIDHYLTPLIYPPGLTRDMQITLILVVIGLNLVIYGFVIWWRCKCRERV